MKISVKFILAAASLILAASCTKENFVESTQSDAKLVTIQLNTVAEEAASDDTKAYVSGYDIYWEIGDSIAVYTAADSEPYCFKAVAVDGTKATFSGEVPQETTDIFAVFPYPAAGGYDGTALKVTLPTSQVVGEHSTAREALVAVAKGTVTSALSFKNVFGLVKVNVKQNNVQAINVKGNGLAGTVKVNAQTGEITESVSLCANATVSSATAMSQSDYYIAVLPGTTESGKFEVGVVSGESTIAGVPCVSFAAPAKAVTVIRNKKLTFDTDNAAFTSSAFGIGTAAQLEAWNNAYAQWTATDKIEFYDDIDATAIENWVGHDFAGTLDGKGHAIKFNVKTAGKATVFGNVTGSISNINFKGNLTCTEPSADSTVVAPIEKLSGNGTLTGIVNKMKVMTDSSVVKATSKNAILAGIVAIVEKGTIENCQNSAIVENDWATDGEATVNTYSIGGIAGMLDGTGISIKACRNEHRLKNYKPSRNLNIGGIAGYSTAKSEVEFTDCNSEYYTSDGSKNVSMFVIDRIDTTTTPSGTEGIANIGGIIGFSKGKDSFTKCVNRSRLNNASDYIHCYYCGGIIGHDTENVSTLNDCHNVVDENNWSIVCTQTPGFNCIEGGMIGLVDGVASIITNCSNQCKISLQAIYSGAKVAGGIVGRVISGNATITGCTNSGQILSNQKHDGTNLCLGGICGHISGCAVKISGCTNTGKVYQSKTTLAQNRWLGGIVAMANNAGVNASEIIDCINNSEIEDKATSTKYRTYASSIIGTASNAGGLTVKGCSVAGTIKVAGNKGTTPAAGEYTLNATNYSDFINFGSTAATITNCSFYTGE